MGVGCSSNFGVVEKQLVYTNTDGFDIVHTELEQNKKKRKKSDLTQQLHFVSAEDSKGFHVNEELYLINSAWLDAWFLSVSSSFSVNDVDSSPGPIKNNILLNDQQKFRAGQMRLKVDYRIVNKAVFEHLFEVYGGGPVVFFKVPSDISAKSLATGKFLKEINLKDNVVVIFPKLIGESENNNEPEELISASSKATQIQAVSVNENIVQKEMGEQAGLQFLHDLGKQKLHQGERKHTYSYTHICTTYYLIKCNAIKPFPLNQLTKQTLN